MISLNNLSKRFISYDVETTALNKINLEIKLGEFISVMGPSGCGKSTLLNIIGMLDSWDEGQYTFFDKPVSAKSEVQRTRLRKEHIGFIFQNFNLIDDLTVYQNVELPLLYQKSGNGNHKEKVMAILEKLNMDHRAKHKIRQLSGGQQQRVAIARALVYEPHILLADEPTGNLDSAHSQEVLEIISKLHKDGNTILMVTHSERDASFSEKILHMQDGAIINQTEVSHV